MWSSNQFAVMKKMLSKGTILNASTVSRSKNWLGCPRINILYISVLFLLINRLAIYRSSGSKICGSIVACFFLICARGHGKLFSISCWEMHIRFILGTWPQIIISTLVLFFAFMFYLKLVKKWVVNSFVYICRYVLAIDLNEMYLFCQKYSSN